MNRYEVTGRATVTTTSGHTKTVILDKEVVTAAASHQAGRAAVIQAMSRDGLGTADTITWFQPADVRQLEGDQPALPIADTPAGNGATRLNPKIIRTDGGTQARAGLNQDKVNEYAERMAEGDKFPAVTVFYDGSAYWLGDGFHRHAAHRVAFPSGMVEIEAQVKQGTRRDAVLFACGANAEHGLQRTREDKQRAIETLLRDEEWGKWSDAEIARRVRVDHKTVAARRAILGIPKIEERTVERNGQTYTMNTAAIGNRPAPDLPRIMVVESEAPAAPAVWGWATIGTLTDWVAEWARKVKATHADLEMMLEVPFHIGWNDLRPWIDREADSVHLHINLEAMRQAVIAVHHRLLEASKSPAPTPPTPITPRAVTLPDSAYKSLHASLHVGPKAGAELERPFFYTFRPYVATSATYPGDGRNVQIFHAYQLIEAHLYDGPTGPLYQGLPVLYVGKEYRLGNPHDFTVPIPAEPVDPLDVLTEKLAALDLRERDLLCTFMEGAAIPRAVVISPAAVAFVEAIVGLLDAAKEGADAT
jgi:hypothetical protein